MSHQSGSSGLLQKYCLTELMMGDAMTQSCLSHVDPKLHKKIYEKFLHIQLHVLPENTAVFFSFFRFNRGITDKIYI